MSDATLAERQTAAQELYTQGDYATAAAKFQEIVASHPMSDQALRGLGFSRLAEGQGAAAVEAFRQAVHINIDNGENHFGHGLALSAVGDESRAVHAFDEALKHQPNHTAARRSLIASLLKMGQQAIADGNISTAEQTLERANKLDKVSPETVTALYKFYLLTGANIKALKLIEYARSHNPDSPQIKELADAIAQNQDLDREKAILQMREDTTAKAAAAPAPNQIPCPSCRQSVMAWASICPHCNFEITPRSQSSRFAAVDVGPRYSWQEIAYYILAGLWIIQGAYTIISGYILASGDSEMGDSARMYHGLLGGFNVAVGIGLMFQVSWMQWLAYLMCLLNLFMSGMGLMVTLGLGAWPGVFYNLFILAIVGFQVYLLRTVGDV